MTHRWTVSVALPVLTIALGLGACARPEPRVTTVPFVGCPADGQTGPIEPPQGTPRQIPYSPQAEEIAFYSGGAFGPRGWSCRVLYGSNGSTLLITPSPLDSSGVSPAKVAGPAIQLSVSDGGTSGRFDVAIFAARLFPRIAKSFVQQVLDEGLETAQDLTLPSFPEDTVRYLDSLTVEYSTPAHSEGLGTRSSLLDSTADGIHGIIVLDTTNDWALKTLTTRLGHGHLARDSVIRSLNLQCLRAADGC